MRKEDLPDLIDMLERLFSAGEYDRVRRTTAQCLKQWPDNKQLLELNAYALGLMNRHAESRKAFLWLYQATKHPMDLANALRAGMAAGDVDSSLRLTAHLFWSLNEQAQKVVLSSILRLQREGRLGEVEIRAKIPWWPRA